MLPFSDWRIEPEEIEIDRRPDGSLWRLGGGGFGDVRFSAHFCHSHDVCTRKKSCVAPSLRLFVHGTRGKASPTSIYYSNDPAPAWLKLRMLSAGNKEVCFL